MDVRTNERNVISKRKRVNERCMNLGLTRSAVQAR